MVFSHHQQQQQEEKYAKIIIFYGFQTLRPSSSSSRKQEWLKSSFSICFRSYGRDFWEQFWCFSVLHCHGVFSSGRCIWAAAHRRWRFSILHYNGVFPSAAAGEKNVTSSVSTGFRSYVRDFLGASLMLLRPSLPWCFPIREVHLSSSCSSSRRKNLLNHHFVYIGFGSCVRKFLNVNVDAAAAAERNVTSSVSTGFRSYVRDFLGAILTLLRPSLPWCDLL